MKQIEESTYNELHKLLGELAWWANDDCSECPNTGDIITVALKAEELLKKLEDNEPSS
jgi:endonuclease III-like uncharacterized protein